MQLWVGLAGGNSYSLTQWYSVFLEFRKLPWGGQRCVNDGLERPTLNLCGLRFDFTTKHATWVFGMEQY